MSLTVAILAGGLATRMHPLTRQVPKSLIRVADDFFINHQLRYLSEQGIKKVVLCVGHLAEQIELTVGSGENLGLEILYSQDGPQLLGTGGALRKALSFLGEAFFILYGDSYLPIDFSAVEKKFYSTNKLALMTVFKNKNRWDKSNILVRENLVLEYNKQQPSLAMNYIDYGLSILSTSVLEPYPLQEPFDVGELFSKLAQERELIACEVFQRFYEIGSMKGLDELNNLFKCKQS